MLDGIMGGAGMANLIPGGQVLGVVAMGLELAKGLFDKGDMKGAQDALKFLNEVVSQLGAPAGQATEAMPFTNPQFVSGQLNSQLNPQGNAGNQNSSVDISIEIVGGPARPQPINYGALPQVDGSAAGDQRLSDAARPRFDGSDAAKSRALTPGSSEWTTVMWAMQQNPNVRYNADTQQFSLKMSDGSDRQLASLSEAQSILGPGTTRANPGAASALGSFLNQRSHEARQGDQVGDQMGDIQNLVQELKKLLQQFEEAQKMMQQSTIDITVSQAVA